MENKNWKDLPLVSVLLVIINIIVFLICTFTGNLLYNRGMLAVQQVLLEREYGRIVWAMFLHSDFIHIFNNMIILFFFGHMVEKEVGHIRYGLVYFFSGIGGNILSLMMKVMYSETAGTIGASGAIFGLDGMLLALVMFSGKKLKNITPGRVVLMIFASLYGGYTGTNVDNAAHLGGVFTGFVIGVVMCIVDRIRASVFPKHHRIENTER